MPQTTLLKDKTTGHITAPSIYLFLAVALAFLLSGRPVLAIDLQVMIANDPIFGNNEGDDLYTAGLGFELQRGFRRYAAGERMFTDRQAGQRFDETYLLMEHRLPSLGAWAPTVGVGVLHIGRGLLGESVQNSVHRAVGSDLLHLDYLGNNRFFGELTARLERSDLLGEGKLIQTAIELRSAPGFRSWLRTMTTYEATLGHQLTWRVGLGLHAEDVALDLLARNVEKLAPTGELGIAWRSLTLSWTYNDLGTATSHLTLGMSVPLRRILLGAREAAD